MSRQRLFSAGRALLVEKLAITGIQLALVPLLANIWGLNLYGIWAMMITVPVFLALGDFGIVSATWARMTQYIARERWDDARSALHTAWVASYGTATLLVLVVTAAIWMVPDGVVPVAEGFSDAQSRLTLTILTIYGLGTILFRLNTAIFRAARRFDLSIWCNLLSYTLEYGALIAAVLMGAGPVGGALALLSMRVAAILVVLGFSFRLFPDLAPGVGHASRTEWASLWRPALAASAFSFSSVLFLQGSVVLLGAVAEPAVVPAFVAVRTISRLGIQLVSMVSGPIVHEFGHVITRGEWRMAGRYFGIVAGVGAVMGLAMALGLIIFGQWFVELWTHGAIHVEFALVATMALSALFSIVWSPVSNLIQSVNRHASFAFANIAGVALGMGWIAVTARDLGAASAGMAFAIVDALTLAAVIIFVARNWMIQCEFRAGISASLHKLRNPAALLRQLRGNRSP